MSERALIRVTYEDGESTEITVIPSARRAYEAEHGESIAAAMGSGFSGWADFLAWKTLQVRHGETRDLDEWLATVDRLEVAFEPVDPPSGTGRTPSGSSKQRSKKAKTSTG